jgi:hypothetical protein
LHRWLRCSGRMLACCGRGRKHQQPALPSAEQNAA